MIKLQKKLVNNILDGLILGFISRIASSTKYYIVWKLSL